MSVLIGSARIDEHGRATGGAAGDQTGRELSTQAWYKHAKGWRVFRAKSPEAAEKIAQDMQWACDNKHIGYDQGQRLTLYNVSKPLGFNCKAVTTKCETDCSALVRVCCAFAGIMLPNFRTPQEPADLLASGAFIELTEAKYTDHSTYLRRGDILCTRTQGHTVVVLTNGSKYKPATDPALKADAPVPEGLHYGDRGGAVKAMQEALIQWRAGCLPYCGADGDFGSETRGALEAFQEAHDLPVTGVYDEATRKALTEATAPEEPGEDTLGEISAPKLVTVTGYTVNVRSAPGVQGTKVLGVVKQGDRLPYRGEDRTVDGTPWHLVEYGNRNGWISGKFSRVE